MKRILLLVFSCLTLLQTNAQIYTNDSISPWIISIGGGYYIAHDAPASYYSGLDNNRFYNVFVNNSAQNQQRNQVIQDLGGYDFTVRSAASDLVYNNVVSFQFGVSYQLNRNWSVELSFHNVRLTASGIFTLDVNRVISGSPEPFIETGSFRGSERRSHITLGGGYSYDLGQNWYIKGELGADLLVLEVTENIANVVGRDYNIMFSPQNLNTNGTNNFSMGFYAGAVLGYHLPSKFGIALRLNYHSTSVFINDVVATDSYMFIPVFAFTKGF